MVLRVGCGSQEGNGFDGDGADERAVAHALQVAVDQEAFVVSMACTMNLNRSPWCHPVLQSILRQWTAHRHAATLVSLCHTFAQMAEQIDEEGCELALEVAQQGLALHGDQVEVVLTIAEMELALGAVRQARDSAMVAARLAPDDPRPAKLIGQTMLLLGDGRRAFAAFERAMELGLDDDDTRTGRESAWQSWHSEARETSTIEAGDPCDSDEATTRRLALCDLGQWQADPFPSSSLERETFPPGHDALPVRVGGSARSVLTWVALLVGVVGLCAAVAILVR